MVLKEIAIQYAKMGKKIPKNNSPDESYRCGNNCIN